jgi:hypothetical protein
MEACLDGAIFEVGDRFHADKQDKDLHLSISERDNL